MSFLLLAVLSLGLLERDSISAEEKGLKLQSDNLERITLVVAEFTIPKEKKLASVRFAPKSPRGCTIDLRKPEPPKPTPLQLIIREIRRVFLADLHFSTYFNIIDPVRSKKYKFSADINNPDLKGWATTGAQVLISASVTPEAETDELNLNLYDLKTLQLITNKVYRIKEDFRWLAHQMADDVIKILTGNEGVSCTRIAFSLQTGPRGKGLSAIDYDGANLESFILATTLALFPDWSPKGDRIAYCTYVGGSLNSYIFNINSRRSSLLSSREGLNLAPAFSPDEKTIALSLYFGNNLELCLVDETGRILRRLTYSRGNDISPTWSPDGKQIAFVSDRTGSPQIYIINTDGTNLRRLTFSGSYNTSPAWSPKGDLIAFVQRQPNKTNQICITNVSGDTSIRLTSHGYNEEPSWSPDGLHIAFASNRTGNWEIWTMDWNGANQRQVTKTGGAYYPSWSPRLTR